MHVCVCGNEDTTTLPMKCARPSVVVVAGVRIVRSHAILNDVINVRIVECHESINVVIGIRVVLCQPLVHNFGFSSYFFPVAILCTLLHRRNTSFEVWYVHHPSVTVDRRQL